LTTNFESVFSGAGKFTAEAPWTGAELLSRMVKLHYNWKYLFLRPTMSKIIETISSFISSPARAAPVDATVNSPTAALAAVAAGGCRSLQGALKAPTTA